MSRRLPPAVLIGFLVGVLLLSWASVAGPPELLTPVEREEAPRDLAQREEDSEEDVDEIEEAKNAVQQEADLGWVGELLAWLVSLLLGVVAALALAWLWRSRWRRPPPPLAAAVDQLPDVEVAAELAEETRSQLDALDGGEARDSIIRCWQRLEQRLDAAGAARLRHETSTEFVTRCLARLDLDPAATDRLASLYREARFSTHPMGEEARAAARDALAVLHADLAAGAGR